MGAALQDPGLSFQHSQSRLGGAELPEEIAGYTKLSSELGAEETHGLLNRYVEAVDGIVDS